MHRLILLAALAVSAICAQPVDVAGTWTGEMRQKQPNGDVVRQRLVFVLEQTADRITGKGGPVEDPSWQIRDGMIEGGLVTFTVAPTVEDGPTWKFDLRLSGSRLEGQGRGTRGGRSLGTTDVVMNRSE